jgi:hypothetical protein
MPWVRHQRAPGIPDQASRDVAQCRFWFQVSGSQQKHLRVAHEVNLLRSHDSLPAPHFSPESFVHQHSAQTRHQSQHVQESTESPQTATCRARARTHNKTASPGPGPDKMPAVSLHMLASWSYRTCTSLLHPIPIPDRKWGSMQAVRSTNSYSKPNCKERAAVKGLHSKPA